LACILRNLLGRSLARGNAAQEQRVIIGSLLVLRRNVFHGEFATIASMSFDLILPTCSTRRFLFSLSGKLAVFVGSDLRFPTPCQAAVALSSAVHRL
jgi:hypothetical protein